MGRHAMYAGRHAVRYSVAAEIAGLARAVLPRPAAALSAVSGAVVLSLAVSSTSSATPQESAGDNTMVLPVVAPVRGEADDPTVLSQELALPKALPQAIAPAGPLSVENVAVKRRAAEREARVEPDAERAKAPGDASVDTADQVSRGGARTAVTGSGIRSAMSQITATWALPLSGWCSGGGDHARCLAIDVMTSGSDGDEVAQWAVAHAGELGVTYVIWEQRIYNLDRPGWRAMPDRGGATANHYDHVHISFSH